MASRSDAGVTPSEAREPDTSGTGAGVVQISGKSIWQAIGAILITLIGIWVVFQARDLVSMLVISFFFSLALQPAVVRLHRRYGWRRGAAVGVIYLGLLLFLVLMVLVLIPAIAELARGIGENGASWLGSLSDWLDETFGVTLFSESDAAAAIGGVDDVVSEWADDVFGAVTGIASAGIGFIFSLATIAMFTFYFTADEPRLKRAILSLFKPDTQLRLGWTWDQAIVQTGGYFYSRSILMIINGLGFFFTMVAVGMPVSFAVPLSVFGGFVSVFIPAVGTYIGAAIPILVTLAIQGFVAALIVLAYAIAYQQVENYWLSPKISADTMSLNGAVAFGAALAGGAIAGPMGAFMALPVAALITAFVSNYAQRNEVVYHSEYDDPEPEAGTEPAPGTEDSADR